MKVLVETAHADDWEVHAGALVTYLALAGHDITSVVTTFGLRDQMIGDRPAKDVRIEESAAAHALLGLKPNFELATYEQELTVDQARRKLFKEFCLDLKPDVVITHMAEDVNPDHRATAILAMEPCYQLGVNTELLFFEPLSSGRARIDLRPQVTYFIPSHYCIITDHILGRKKQLVDCHRSQDPEGMWYGQENLHKNRGIECLTSVQPGVERRAEAYIAAKRWGDDVLSELQDFLMRTPWNLPRRIGIDFKPETIGLTV